MRRAPDPSGTGRRRSALRARPSSGKDQLVRDRFARWPNSILKGIALPSSQQKTLSSLPTPRRPAWSGSAIFFVLQAELRRTIFRRGSGSHLAARSSKNFCKLHAKAGSRSCRSRFATVFGLTFFVAVRLFFLFLLFYSRLQVAAPCLFAPGQADLKLFGKTPLAANQMKNPAAAGLIDAT